MQNPSNIIEPTKQLLRKWQLPEKLIESAGLFEVTGEYCAPRIQKFQSTVKELLNSFIYIQPVDLRFPGKFDIDATLVALAYHYAKLRQQLSNQVQADYKVLVNLTRKNIFPLVKELGMWDFKRDLEDTLLQLVAQEQYEEVGRWFPQFQSLHHETWNQLLCIIENQCSKAVKGCKAKVVYCGVEGARRRLVRLGGYENAKIQNYARIYLIVPRLVDCYTALAAVHTVGLPEPYSFRDMIATPQPNGYSGLLTSICINHEHAREEQPRQVFEVLILTDLMEQVAHRGITYPLCYQAIRNNLPIADPKGEEHCIQCLVQSFTSKQSDEATKITVFTAKGEAKELRAGSTVLDLAYKLHTEIGNHAESAEINGKWVPLGTQLKHGDRVRINRVEHQKIRTEADLQSAFEPWTKRKISTFLNKDSSRKGRHLLATYLRNRNVEIEAEQLDSEAIAVCQSLGMNDPNELYRAIAEKKEIPGHPYATPGLIGALIIQRRLPAVPEVPILTTISPTTDWVPSLDEMNNNDTLPFRLCGICRPNPLHQIVCVRTKKCLAVHTTECYRIRGKILLNLQWQRNIRTLQCTLSISASDRPLLIQNITEVIYRHDVGLEKIHGEASEFGRASIVVDVYVKGAIDIVELMMDLANIRSVQQVKLQDSSLPLDVKSRIQRGPIDRHLINELEREGFGKPRTMLFASPINTAQRYGDINLGYNDQKPTFTKNMFFGRQNEVNRLKTYLVGSVGGIALVTGPKRVGKTSLCLRFLDGLSPSTQPHLIRVDLRTHHRSSSPMVFEDISDALKSKFHLSTERVHNANGLINLIEIALTELGGRQLILVFDEFGGPLQSFANGLLGRELFEFINSVLDRNLPLSILLVTPPAGLAVLNNYDVWSILRPMPSISLGALEPEDAKEMIIRPFSYCGVSFKPTALKKILFLTGHYPYYIILMLKEILAILNSQQSKVHVNETDIGLATKKLLRMDSLFNPLLKEASRIPFALNCLRILSMSKWNSDNYAQENLISYITERDLFSLLKEDNEFSELKARLAIEQLVEDKILERQYQAKGIGYKFSIPLFHHWLEKREKRGLDSDRIRS